MGRERGGEKRKRGGERGWIGTVAAYATLGRLFLLCLAVF